MTIDLNQPDGFNLDAEASRADDAALGGIVARETAPELDAESPVNGDVGAAENGDDDVVEDADREPLPADL